MIVTCNTAGAITISTSAADWDGYAVVGAGPSLTESLKVTASTSGGNISAFSETANFQNATINLKWKVDGGSRYNAFSIGLGEWNVSTSGHDVMANTFFTTDHTYNGNAVIADDTWYYTTLSILANQTFSINTYTGGYNNAPGFLGSRSDTLSTASWSKLADASIWLGINDNYFTNASITLGEANYENNPTPEPSTMLLLSFGLIGLVGAKRKFKK